MELKSGQAWALPSDDRLPPLVVVIGRIDEHQHGRIAGVSITPHPDAQELGWPPVSHLPIAVDTLGLENAQLVEEATSVDSGFDEGYRIWSEQFEIGKAGVFSISTREAYGTVLNIAIEQE